MNIFDVLMAHELAAEVQAGRKRDGLPPITMESIMADMDTKPLPSKITNSEESAQVSLALLIYWKGKLPPALYRRLMGVIMEVNLFALFEIVDKVPEPNGESNDQPNEHRPDPNLDEGGIPTTEPSGKAGGKDDLGVR